MIRQATTRLLFSSTARRPTSILRAVTRKAATQRLPRLSYSNLSLLHRPFQFHEGLLRHPQRYTEQGEWMFGLLILGLSITTAGSVTLMEAHASGAFDSFHNKKRTTTMALDNNTESNVDNADGRYHLLTFCGGGDDSGTAVVSSTIKATLKISYHQHFLIKVMQEDNSVIVPSLCDFGDDETTESHGVA